MKEIVKVLLQEGIDESMINRVLDLIEEEYEIISELNDRAKVDVMKKRIDNMVQATQDALKSNNKFPKNGSIEDQEANLLQTAKLMKTQKEAKKKLDNCGRLAGKSIKDPEMRKEVIEYAGKHLV